MISYEFTKAMAEAIYPAFKDLFVTYVHLKQPEENCQRLIVRGATVTGYVVFALCIQTDMRGNIITHISTMDGDTKNYIDLTDDEHKKAIAFLRFQNFDMSKVEYRLDDSLLHAGPELNEDAPVAQCSCSDGDITMRHYFAAKAMQGMLANHSMIDTTGGSTYEWMAKEAFKFADAMIAENINTKK